MLSTQTEQANEFESSQGCDLNLSNNRVQNQTCRETSGRDHLSTGCLSQDSTVVSCWSVNFIYCHPYSGDLLVLALSLFTHVHTPNNCLCFISANIPAAVQLRSSTNCHLYPVSSPIPHWNTGVATSVHRQNIERFGTMTHLMLWVYGGGAVEGEVLTHKKLISNTVIKEWGNVWKIDWCADFSFSSSSFHVSMSLCLCAPEMTTSPTLSVRRLTARPAAAMPERINARGKTLVLRMRPGSLRRTLQGWLVWFL